MSELAYIKTPSFMLKLFKGYSEYKISKKIEKLLFFYFSCMMALGAFLWAVICLFQGYYMPAIIPFSYVIATLLNFLLSSQVRDNSISGVIQVFISIALPFIFQYSLGGIVNSGFVMFWSVLALLGSMTFQNNKDIVGWVALFAVLCFHAFYVEATEFAKTARNLPILLTGLNLITVSTIIFGLAHYFVRMQERLQATYATKRGELQVAQEKIDSDLCLAKEFQELLHSSGFESKAFAKKLVFNQSKHHVNGNFHWQGDFANRHVVVFVENPHAGIRGSMEAMLLWRMIENSVSRAEVQAPQHLIESIQRDLYSRYEAPQVMESIKEIKMTVLCHDKQKNEISYASLGSTLLVNDGESVKVLSGFNTDNSQEIAAPNGAKMRIGRFMPFPSAKLLFVNDAILEALNISDDQELCNKTNKLNSFFEWDFSIGNIELQKEVDKQDSESDLFLLALQLA